MALDVQYATELTDRVKSYDVKWIEQPLMPDEYAAHGQLAAMMTGMGSTTLFATGEHEYTRWGFQELIKNGAPARRIRAGRWPRFLMQVVFEALHVHRACIVLRERGLDFVDAVLLLLRQKNL